MDNDFIYKETSKIHKIMAERMTESWTQTPQFNLTMEICLDNLFRVKNDLNKEGKVVSFTDLIILGTSRALSQNPNINSCWSNGMIKLFKHINLGLAVAADDELIVVVIKDADKKEIKEIANETKLLIKKVNARKFKLDDITNSTFTISNLGMFGIQSFTAILNPPEASILAIGSAMKRQIYTDNQVLEKTLASFTLTVDHRVASGVIGATFLASIKDCIENIDKFLE